MLLAFESDPDPSQAPRNRLAISKNEVSLLFGLDSEPYEDVLGYGRIGRAGIYQGIDGLEIRTVKVTDPQVNAKYPQLTVLFKQRWVICARSDRLLESVEVVQRLTKVVAAELLERGIRQDDGDHGLGDDARRGYHADV